MSVIIPTIIETYIPLLSFLICGAVLFALILAISPIYYLGNKLIDYLTRY